LDFEIFSDFEFRIFLAKVGLDSGWHNSNSSITYGIAEGTNMDLNRMIETLKAHPESGKIGMIASHLGIVRGVSRNGRDVSGIEVVYDHKAIDSIIRDIKKLPGIIEVLVDTNEGRLQVGDPILAVAVAGDLRENVFPALIESVNRLKKEASKKKERFNAR
jgi:molybdopterin synthase catalytic subunit